MMILRLAFASKTTEKYGNKGEQNEIATLTNVEGQTKGLVCKNIRVSQMERGEETWRENKISRRWLTFHKDF